MMIHLALSLLLDHLAVLRSTGKQVTFVGTDSSFTIRFRPTRRGIAISSGNTHVGTTRSEELFAEVLRAAEEFAGAELHRFPDDDAAGSDLAASLRQFRTVVP
ncbi:hypothetical protein ACFWVC_11780 [Streptomyces sp. NPDC058691]|uniref:hypothetical protein n=1 Tax=Streptomyces sp. NPDC058691 TaxID=3346601 RepID=UPI00365357CB